MSTSRLGPRVFVSLRRRGLHLHVPGADPEATPTDQPELDALLELAAGREPADAGQPVTTG